jgi:DNA topoisomerase-1
MFLPTSIEPASSDGAKDVGAALQAALETARDAGLRYVSASSPGLRRIRTRTGFSYRSAEGRPVRAARDLERRLTR